MAVSRSEAESALREITQAERRSSTAYGYRMAWPHFIVWGIAWVIGYGLGAAHVTWTPLWPVLSVVGSVASFWVGWRMSRAKTSGFDWRYGATFFSVLLFVVALLVILKPAEEAQFAAFFPILVAFYYVLIGIWTRGTRMLLVGAALGILTMVGFFWLRDVLDLWMAVVGGGGLILGGFWLKSA